MSEIPMMMAQITAKAGRGRASFKSHSTPAIAASVADVMIRLMMYATGNHVEDDEGGSEAGDGRSQPHQSAFGKHSLAHAQYVGRNTGLCNG